jgi:hypothetical protein
MSAPLGGAAGGLNPRLRAVTWRPRLRDKCGTRRARPGLLSLLDLGFCVA